MVAKKTAVEQSASGRSTHARAPGGTAKDVAGKKSAVKAVGAAAQKTAAKKTTAKKAAVPQKKSAARKATAAKAAPAGPTDDDGSAAGRPEAGAAGGEKAAATKGAAPRAGKAAVTKKKAVAKKTAAKRTAAKDTAVTETVATEAGAPQGDAGQGTSGKSSPTKRAARKSTAKKAGAAEAAKQTGATTVVAKKTPGTATAAKTAVPNARIAAVVPGELAVRAGEDPWTPEEVAEARAELTAEVLRLRTEITTSEESLVGLMRDSGDGAGDDQADTGTKNITRESEMALAANAREMLIQTERALGRLDAGTYGLCENCGNAIGKARMQAFPRATLCVECKQKQERRY